jgi:hypothetical protein
MATETKQPTPHVPVVPRPRLADYLLYRPHPSNIVAWLALVGMIIVAGITFRFAYQTQPSYKIDIGERADRPYMFGFNTREPSEKDRGKAEPKWDGIGFRWSRGESNIELPGIGSQTVSVTLRLFSSPNPSPTLTAFVGENRIDLPPVTEPGWTERTFVVPKEFFPDGNLKIRLVTTPFKPRGDDQLGLAYDWVTVTPVPNQNASIGVPDKIYYSLNALIGLLVLTLVSLRVPLVPVLGSSALAIFLLAYWLGNDRLSLTVFLAQPDVLPVIAGICGVAVLLVSVAPWVYGKLGVHANKTDAAWLGVLFLLFFVVLWGVQAHPQFVSSDVGLASRHMLSVRVGQFVLAEPLPNGQLSPYAPAFYLLLQPFTFIYGQDRAALEKLIVLANSFFAASGVFLVFYLAGLLRQKFAPGKRVSANIVGLLAAAFYTVNRYHFYIFSQGNHANLFASWAFLLLLCVLAGCLMRLNNPVKNPALQITLWSLPFATLFLVYMSHYGAFLFGTVFMVICAVGLLFINRRNALLLGAGWLITLLVSWFLYYHNHAKIILAPFTAEKSATEKRVFEIGGFFRAVYGSARDNFGLIVILCAAGGLVLLISRELRASRYEPEESKELSVISYQSEESKQLTVNSSQLENSSILNPQSSILGFILHPSSLILLAVLVTAAGFAFAEVWQGLETRYQLYIITPSVILAGLFLNRLWRSSWAGVALSVALLGFQFLAILLFWLDRVLYYGFNAG